MTFEELKAEAKRQGYNLIKQPTYIPLKPCVCGAKRSVKMFYSTTGQGYMCLKCRRESERCKTKNEARLSWNKRIEVLQNG